MAGRLQDKVALVTGAASGIGRTTALTFAREGAKVVVSDIVPQGGNETVRMIKEAGGEAIFVKADVSRTQDVEAMIQKTVETYGRLDCAFNNAGIEGPMNFMADCTEEDFDRTMRINLKGVWLCLKYEIPQMVKQGGGAIVNAASVAGLVGSPGIGVYSASKGGVIQLTRTAALEYAKDGVRVNAVCPGAIVTPMLQRIQEHYLASQAQSQAALGTTPVGKPEDVAEAVVWLCSDAACFINGHAMAVDGGYVAG
jgi:NAD(P)-dependent dehydrogenase (short-subunit alcohol dehydrogenase family)